MDSGPASRTRSSAKRTRCDYSTTKRLKTSNNGPSLNRLPNEILEFTLEYAVSYDGSIWLRLVSRRFDAIISSLLLSCVSALASTGPYLDYHTIEFQMNDYRNLAGSSRMNEPLCPIDAHVRHVTIELSDYDSIGNYDEPANIKAYQSLLVRIVKRMPKLKSVKLLYDLDNIDVQYSGFVLEGSQTGMDKLISSTLNRIPANIHVEVELFVSTVLDAGSVSLRQVDWKAWRHNNQFYRVGLRKVLDQWPKSINEVWSMVDSLHISARIAVPGDVHPFISPPALGDLSKESISNQHIYCLSNQMVPGAFLTLQFPKGFPPHLKKLHLRDPLIVNTTRVLQFLRDCQNLKDLSLFVIFNLERVHEEHGLPPGLETLELFESGGTILPVFYDRLRQFRYTFIGEPSDSHINRVRHFIEHTHIPQLEQNIVSSSELKDMTHIFNGLSVGSPINLGGCHNR